MLGFIGNSFLGERLFYVVKKNENQTISMADYLIYNDIIYYGEPDEKYQNSFKMMDLESRGAITLDKFLEFGHEFIKMYG